MQTVDERKRDMTKTPEMIVVYSPKMFAANPGHTSPSAGKPKKVIADWQANDIPIQIIEPQPLSPDEIAVAHDKVFVKEILSCKTMNGFDTKDPEVAASLPYTNGGLYTAAKLAIQNKAIVCAPVSGFHHAGWDSCGLFCTFNGLMIASLLLLKRDEAQRVGILDCDRHYGNGTDDILRRQPSHIQDRIRHFSAGRHHFTANAFFKALQEALESFADCDVLLYQAGADPHINDPLGGFLTTEELIRRDGMVFDWSRRTGVPVAWNLAGGYQKTPQGDIPVVLEIHRNTARLALGMSVSQQ